ncbi:MAG: Ldh family oxidoreductase [Caldilineaceae bacterium]
MAQGHDGLAHARRQEDAHHLGHHQRRSLHRRSRRGHDGTLLPMGEYKGAGLSVITDVLTGVLSGSGAFGTIPYSNPTRQEVAHQFIAYDIDWFMPRAEFYADLAQFVAMMRASRTRPDVDEILLPGELEWRRMQEKKAGGVPVDPVIYAELKEAAAEVGVAWTLEE